MGGGGALFGKEISSAQQQRGGTLVFSNTLIKMSPLFSTKNGSYVMKI